MFTFINQSIRNKLIVFLLTAIIVPIVTSLVISYEYTKQSVTNQAIIQNSNLLYQGKINITNYFNFMNKISLTAYNDTFYSDTLYKIIARDLSDDSSEQVIYRVLQFFSTSVDNIYQVNLYIKQSQRSYTMIHDFIKKESAVDLQIPPANNGYNAYVEPPHLSSSYGIYTPKNSLLYFAPEEVISLHRPIYEIPRTNVLGLVSIDIKMDKLSSICTQLYTQGKEELYILDHDGTVVYSPQRQQVGKKLAAGWVQQILQRPDQQGNLQWKDSQFSGIQIYEKVDTPYFNWTIVKRIPYNQLYSNARQLTLINTLLFSFFLVIAIIATVYISIMLTKPIKKLIGYINKIQRGNMNIDIEVHSSDEIGILAARFQNMMQTINNLILQEYRLELANKTNQLKALQAQINPHFMYNSLQSIGTLALQMNAPKIYSLISSLGKMMRYTINTNENTVPLSKELEHIQHYLELQKQRFEESLCVTFEIEERSNAVLMPKMILQPLVENYFKHGFDPQKGLSELHISSTFTGDDLLMIRVRDNGPGMPEEHLQQLKKQITQPNFLYTEHMDNIGILNVLARLQLYFSEQAGMQIQNLEPHGFQITLQIPLIKENNPL